MAQESRHCGGRFAARLPPPPGISSRRLATGVFFCLRLDGAGAPGFVPTYSATSFSAALSASERVISKADAPRVSLTLASSAALARRSSPEAESRL